MAAPWLERITLQMYLTSKLNNDFKYILGKLIKDQWLCFSLNDQNSARRQKQNTLFLMAQLAACAHLPFCSSCPQVPRRGGARQGYAPVDMCTVHLCYSSKS